MGPDGNLYYSTRFDFEHGMKYDLCVGKGNIRCMVLADFDYASPKDIHRCQIFMLPPYNMSQCMRFPTMWYVGPAKAQTSLRIRAD